MCVRLTKYGKKYAKLIVLKIKSGEKLGSITSFFF